MHIWLRARTLRSSARQTPRLAKYARTYAAYDRSTASAPSSEEAQRARQYCMQLLQKYDSPSHTLLPFISPPAQTAYLAIRAFNVELARIPDSVTTAAVGALRYQFWRDNLDAAFAGNPPKQPVTILLAHALAELEFRSPGSRLSKSWFTRIIAAREQYANGRPYPDLEALERYAENTYSNLMYLTLQALPASNITLDHIASHIGKASGIVAVLRGLPLLAFPPPANHHSNNGAMGGSQLSGNNGSSRGIRGAVLLPLDIMAQSGLREEDVFRHGSEAKGLKDAVFHVATRASDHLITARELMKRARKGQAPDHEYEHENERERDELDNEVRGQRNQSVSAETPIARSVNHESGSMRERKDADNADLNQAFGIMMPAVATQLWLHRLQKYDFDIFRPELRSRDWKLPFSAFWANYTRSF